MSERPLVSMPAPVNMMKFVWAFWDGGTERQVIDLALSLEPSRVAVHFGCLRRTGPLVEEIDARRLPVFDYGIRTFRHPAVIAAQLRLARDIRRHRIQIVHTYGFSAHLFAIPAAKLAGARVVASIRDMGVYLSSTQLRLQRLLCRLADQILVNASAIRDWLVSDGYDASHITVVPNGMNLTRFAQRPATGSVHREFGIPLSAPLIGVVGRVTRLKGIENFLRAAALIAPRFPEARFVILGGCVKVSGRTVVNDEAYFGELNSLAAELGVRDRLVFTGFRPDVAPLLPELSVSVLASLSEGLSNTLLESMSAGVPVIATNVGGTPEAVQDGENGLLIPPGDPRAIADAVCRILDEPALARRLASAARRSVAERYSMSRVAESTTRIYESMLESGSPAATRESLNPI